MNVSSILFCVSVIVTSSETGSPSDDLGYPLSLFGTIISILNCYPKSPLNKSLLLVIIEVLIFCNKGHEKCGVSCHPFSKYKGKFHWLYIYHKYFLGNCCSNIYSSSSLFAFFSSVYSTYVEWMHVVQILQIQKFQYQFRMALC